MLEEGRVSPALANAALDRHRSTGERFEEALLECGLPESMLLRHLAEIFGTRFISTKTLANASVPRSTLQRLPRRLAERYQVIPLRFAEDDLLTVVTTEPNNPQLLESVRVSAGARMVKGLVARPAAIAAGIAKLYGGDAQAFARIAYLEEARPSRPEPPHGNNGAPPSPAPRQSLEDPLADVQLDTSAFDAPAFDAPAFDASGFDGASAEPDAPSAGFEAQPSAFEAAPRGFDSSPYAFEAPQPGSFDAPPSGFDAPAAAFGRSRAAARDGAEPAAEAANGAAPPASPPLGAQPSPGALHSWITPGEMPPDLDTGSPRARANALGDPSKLAESLMIIHERTRGSLKSHSVRVARLAYSLCQKLDLSEPQAAHAWAIGLFHDLGKSQHQHLTPLNVWQLPDHEVTARAQYKNPGRLLKNADVPETVTTAILHMYERYDGQGFPNGLSEEAIPFQSRVLALCDSIADLTLNPDNTLGRIVSPIEACNHLRALTPKVFDPMLLAHFSRLLVERKLDGVFLSERSVHGIEKLLG